MHLHIGVAKSGTTYLQRILFDNRAMLEEHGVLYPGANRADHFLASMDLRGSGFQGHVYPKAEGVWQRLVDEVDRFRGVSLISHETLARTPKELIAKAVSAFDTDDVRVVVTARDLARQVPAVWQERVKNRNEERYGDFLSNVFRSEQGRRRKGGFWIAQDLGGLTRRWMSELGEDRLTVVTVPRPGADRMELWRRFTAAVGLPDLAYVFDQTGSNPSLGVVESEFLRRLNAQVAALEWPQYEARVKHRFAERTLVNFSSGARLTIPREYHDDIDEVSNEMIDSVRQSGCRVVGDLEDLRPDLSGPVGPTPDEVEDSALLDLALGLVGEFASRPLMRAAQAPPPRWPLASRVKARVRDIVAGRPR